MHHSRVLILLSTLLLAGCTTPGTPPQSSASSQEQAAVCALCEKPIPAGQEVTVTDGENTTLYRCPHCALTAQAGLAGRSTLRARSGVTGSAIEVVHDGDRWDVEPSSAVFLSLPETAGECLARHKAFTDEREFATYLAGHPEFEDLQAHPYTIDEVARILAAGLPRVDTANNAGAGAPRVLVVGMLTHLPFKSDVLPELERAFEPLRGRLDVQFVDASQAPGQAILAAHGIHEHLPVVVFVDDRAEFELEGEVVRFAGFPGEGSWTGEQLAAVLHGVVGTD